MWKFLQDHLVSPTIAKVLAMLVPTVLAVAVWAREGLIQQAKELSPQLVALLLTLSIVLIIILLARVFYLLPSFKYIEKFQVYQHRINGLYYCPKCRDRKPLTPLKADLDGWGWRCTFNDCRQWYKKPDYKKLPKVDSGP